MSVGLSWAGSAQLDIARTIRPSPILLAWAATALIAIGQLEITLWKTLRDIGISAHVKAAAYSSSNNRQNEESHEFRKRPR